MANAIRWDTAKNLLLKAERGVCFEDVLSSIEQGGLVATIEHPNKRKFGHQRIMIVRIRGYAYLIPFSETPREIFLKTIIPSRKATRDFMEGPTDES
jgi:hypothetical protein